MFGVPSIVKQEALHKNVHYYDKQSSTGLKWYQIHMYQAWRKLNMHDGTYVAHTRKGKGRLVATHFFIVWGLVAETTSVYVS